MEMAMAVWDVCEAVGRELGLGSRPRADWDHVAWDFKLRGADDNTGWGNQSPPFSSVLCVGPLSTQGLCWPMSLIPVSATV